MFSSCVSGSNQSFSQNYKDCSDDFVSKTLGGVSVIDNNFYTKHQTSITLCSLLNDNYFRDDATELINNLICLCMYFGKEKSYCDKYNTLFRFNRLILSSSYWQIKKTIEDTSKRCYNLELSLHSVLALTLNRYGLINYKAIPKNLTKIINDALKCNLYINPENLSYIQKQAGIMIPENYNPIEPVKKNQKDKVISQKTEELAIDNKQEYLKKSNESCSSPITTLRKHPRRESIDESLQRIAPRMSEPFVNLNESEPSQNELELRYSDTSPDRLHAIMQKNVTKKQKLPKYQGQDLNVDNFDRWVKSVEWDMHNQLIMNLRSQVVRSVWQVKNKNIPLFMETQTQLQTTISKINYMFNLAEIDNFESEGYDKTYSMEQAIKKISLVIAITELLNNQLLDQQYKDLPSFMNNLPYEDRLKLYGMAGIFPILKKLAADSLCCISNLCEANINGSINFGGLFHFNIEQKFWLHLGGAIRCREILLRLIETLAIEEVSYRSNDNLYAIISNCQE